MFLSKFNNFGLALCMAFTFYTSVEKGLKLKVWKLWGLIPSPADKRYNMVIWMSYVRQKLVLSFQKKLNYF